MPADLLGLFEEHGLNPKKKTGSEWGAKCPACGGTDRCMVRPGDHDGRGGYHCRQCGTYGDNIQFLRDFEGMSYQDACKHLGVTAARATAALPKPPRKAPGQEPFEAVPSIPPAEIWTKRATAFATWAHQHLLVNPEQLAWLAKRGLPLEAVKTYQLGWNPGERGKSCLIRPRSVWGLPLPEPKLDAEGNPQRPKTTFWIPRGLVIPMLDPDGKVLRLRIRRPESDRAEFREETKYYVIPGSNMDAMILGADSKAFMPMESDLDAYMVHFQAGDLIGVVSMMTSNVKKVEAKVLEILSRALCILVALDFDKAGVTGWERWKASFPRAKRWPVPRGDEEKIKSGAVKPAKDPGEYVEKHDGNIRAWIMAGLPPVLQPGLLPPGKPVLEEEGEALKRAGVSASETGLSPIGAPESDSAAAVSTPLPDWMQPLSAPELEAFGPAGGGLLEMCSLMDAYQAEPVVLCRPDGDRGIVLRILDRVWFAGADPAGFERLRDLFFGVCMGTWLTLAIPKKLRAAKTVLCCHGQRDASGDWAMLVKNDGGLACVGWSRLEHWGC